MKNFVLFCLVLLLCSFAVVAADFSNSTTNKEWLQYGRTFDNSRYYPGTLNLTNYGQLWNKTANNFTNSYVSVPVAKDGVIYVPAITGAISKISVIFALNVSTGATIWNTTIPSFNAVMQHSAIAGDRLFVTGSTNSADVFALNRSDGTILWNATSLLSGGAYPTAPLVYDDRLYVLGYHSTVNAHPLLYVFNITDGTQITNRTVIANNNYRGAETMAVYNDSYLLVAAGHGTCPGFFGKVYAYNISDVSQQFWTQDVGCGRIEGIALKGEYIFVPTNGNKTLYAVNATNGNHIWNYTASNDIRSSPAVLDTAGTDYVYVGSHDNVMHALNISTGAQVWNATLAINSETAPLVTDNVVFGSSGFSLRAFNPFTGVSLWNGTLNTPSASAPIFVNDPLFIVTSTAGGNLGYLYSFGQVPGCGKVNQSITLTRDLSTNGTCFTVNTSNVVIDCNGHTITGNFSPLSKGALLLKNNITLKNCNFRNFLWGIYLDNSNDSTILNNSANNNTFTGLIFQRANNATVTGNTFNDNNVGIYLWMSNFSSFDHNYLDNNTFGIQFVSAAGFNNFSDMRITNSNTDGIEILDGTSANNRFVSINISNSSTFDLDLTTPSPINDFFDILVGPISTMFSFDSFNGTTKMKGVQTAPAAPAGKRAVNKYVNITKTAGDWIVLNISYTNANIANIVENSIRMYRFTGGAWQLVPNSAVFAVQNYVSANLSNFSSFGLFGNRKTTSGGRRTTGGGGGASYGGSSIISPTDAPTTTTTTPTQTPKATPSYTSSREYVEPERKSAGIDSYAKIDDMMGVRADAVAPAEERASSGRAGSVAMLVVALLVIGGIAAYLLVSKQTQDKINRFFRFKK